LQSVDYLVLQMLNRQIPVLKHFAQSRFVHPERLFDELLRLAGELATFATRERRAREYPAYDHDDLENVFAPLIRDIQDFLGAQLGRRAIRLEVIERARNAFVSPIRDRSLFRNATFVLEVAAQRPLIEIQHEFPQLFKVGPNTKMNDIVHAHLPGVPLVHLPTPPPHIRAITDHVYFFLDRKSPLWPDFSTAASIAMHFSDDWPGLELELWAIMENRQ
jgi:type VI secretion system protein ImpJ